MAGVERFLKAQDGGEFEAALAEITSGQKIGHWIWYVFPQLAGLGISQMSQLYGIRDRAEAVTYLRDSILRSRLEALTAAAAIQIRRGVSVKQLMGSAIDARKFVSSLTLFDAIARDLIAGGDEGVATFASDADDILDAAQAEGYPPCGFTIQRLGAAPP
jgi:uncharacterized protein (DUF1810 family)